MKSIVEEGSSVFKAIEKGWTRAGKPSHFTVKIFELPEKNFFGMTTKQAKIGIMFEHEGDMAKSHKSSSASHPKKNMPSNNVNGAKKQQPERVAVEKASSSHGSAKVQEKQSSDNQKKQNPPRDTRKPDALKEKEKKAKEPVSSPVVNREVVDMQKEQTAPSAEQPTPVAMWNDDLMNVMHTLIKESMTELGYPNIEFSCTIDQSVLRVAFSAPILDNPTKEKQFFQNYAFLLITLLRTHTKANVKNLRLFLSSDREQIAT